MNRSMRRRLRCWRGGWQFDRSTRGLIRSRSGLTNQVEGEALLTTALADARAGLDMPVLILHSDAHTPLNRLHNRLFTYRCSHMRPRRSLWTPPARPCLRRTLLLVPLLLVLLLALRYIYAHTRMPSHDNRPTTTPQIQHPTIQQQ